jgi:hypothetical protein
MCELDNIADPLRQNAVIFRRMDHLPPIETRFSPSNTGNRAGRPKNADTRARLAAAAKLVALESLIDRCLSGDPASLALLMALQRPQAGSPAADVASPATTIGEAP